MVSSHSVRVCLIAAVLNELEVLACDKKGASMTAPTREKVVTTAGEKFDP